MQKKRLAVLVFMLLALSAACWWWAKARREAGLTYIQYPAFGIYIPQGFLIHGIDVSHYQHTINWPLASQMKVGNIALGFCLMKATEGADLKDDQFNRNWKKCKQAGMVRGAYHYFTSNKSGLLQAQNFIETVALATGDFPPVLDVEAIGNTPADSLRMQATIWLQVVGRHYKTTPIIYTGVDFYKKYLGINFNNYPLWIAHYEQPILPRINRSWSLWQHNNNGRVNGIAGAVDFNVFNGDSASFKTMLLH